MMINNKSRNKLKQKNKMKNMVHKSIKICSITIRFSINYSKQFKKFKKITSYQIQMQLLKFLQLNGKMSGAYKLQSKIFLILYNYRQPIPNFLLQVLPHDQVFYFLDHPALEKLFQPKLSQQNAPLILFLLKGHNF